MRKPLSGETVTTFAASADPAMPLAEISASIITPSLIKLVPVTVEVEGLKVL